MVRALGVCIAIVVLAAGCGGPLPSPRIDSIVPGEITEGEVPQVVIGISAVMPFFVDYGRSEGSVDPGVQVKIGGRSVIAPMLTADRTVVGTAPFGLPPGDHDVAITLSDGRAAISPASFQVRPGVFPDSFTIDPIAPQTRGTPFDITIRAAGPGALEFTGAVELTTDRGTVEPAVSGPFSGGVRVERVTVTAIAQELVITVRDAQGHTGSSNAFRVTP